MHFDFGILKRHPVASIGGGLVVFIIIYYLANSGSSSGAATSSASAGGIYGLNSNDLAYLQLQAGQSAQAAQAGAAVQVATLQAGVQNNQTAAQVQENNDNLAAQIAAIEAQTQAAIVTNASNNDTQVQLAGITTSAQTSQVQIQAQENEAQTAALAGVITGQQTAETQQKADQLNYLYGVSQLQAAVASQGLQDQTVVAEKQIENQAQVEQTVANNVTNINGSQNRLALLQSLLGQPGAATATEQSYAQVNPGSSASSIINSIGTVSSNILAGFLA